MNKNQRGCRDKPDILKGCLVIYGTVGRSIANIHNQGTYILMEARSADVNMSAEVVSYCTGYGPTYRTLYYIA